jgi:coenzyme F420-0:L-glutamate ligase/coenzyme F420-1:gamma-L-glutamate ligase
LPLNPDESAKKIRDDIRKMKEVDLAIIISDTHGRAFREGAINVAIGVSGLEPVLSYQGQEDLYGNILRTTKVAIVDELASAAELLMGEANEKIPAVIIRGYEFEIRDELNLSKKLIRKPEMDLFR